MDDITPQPNIAGAAPTEKSSPKRNILLVAGITLVVILMGVLSYFLMFKKTSPATQQGATFPVGGNTQTTEQPIDNTSIETNKQPEGGTLGAELQKLVELYKGPVAGYTLLAGGRTIRLFDRTLGRLVEINVNNGETRTMSDQPILNIHDATFLGNSKLILRALDDSGVIKSTLYTITETTNDNAPLLLDKPVALADDILEVAQNGDGGIAVLVIKDPLGVNIDQLDTASQTLSRKGTLPLTEWIPTVTNNGSIYLSAKASRFAMSGTYKLINKKLVMSIPAGIAQTSNIAPTGVIAYNSGSYGGVYSAEVRDPNILSGTEPSSIPFVTLGEKCAWQSDAALYCGVPNTRGDAFPDDWYLGVAHFNDTLHRYNTTTNTDELLLDPNSLKTTLDMINITPGVNAVFLKNKTDEHLWMLRLAAITVNTGTSTTASGENL